MLPDWESSLSGKATRTFVGVLQLPLVLDKGILVETIM